MSNKDKRSRARSRNYAPHHRHNIKRDVDEDRWWHAQPHRGRPLYPRELPDAGRVARPRAEARLCAHQKTFWAFVAVRLLRSQIANAPLPLHRFLQNREDLFCICNPEELLFTQTGLPAGFVSSEL